MSTDPQGPAGGGPVDEVGVDLGPDEARGLLDGWTATGGTGDRTGERTGALGTDRDAAHARLAALAEAGSLLRKVRLPQHGSKAEWLLRASPDPLPLADGLPPPPTPLPATGGGAWTPGAISQRPFWSTVGPDPEGRPTDSGDSHHEERTETFAEQTDTLGGAGRTHPGVVRPTEAVVSGPPGRMIRRHAGAFRAGPSRPAAWLLPALGILLLALVGAVALLVIGR